MNLFDIIDKQKWQKMQDGFSKALGVRIWTVDLQGKPLSGTDNADAFCLDFFDKEHKNGKPLYEGYIPELINRIKKDKTDNYYICPFGLFLYGIPIDIGQKTTLAYVILGPVLLGKQKKLSEFKKIAKENNIPVDDLICKLAGLKSFTFNGIESTVELLHEVAHHLVQLSCDIKQLKKRFNVPGTLDDLIKGLYSSVYFDELLNVLLDTSLHTTKGNTGSIMLLDADKDELSVRFSRGLKDEIAKEARVKIGEGISGVVARNRKPLLIYGGMGDPEIKDRLKRPNIKSSIVYPLKIRNRLFGVMNINDTNPAQRFNSESLNIISSLTNLTEVALSMFAKK